MWSPPRAGRTLSMWLGCAGLFSLLALYLVAQALWVGPYRDEHQFVSAGVLLAREGLLPYKDFPYFHMPNLVWVYAWLFRLADQPLTAARFFNAACDLGALAFIFTFAVHRLSGHLAFPLRLGVAVAAVIMFSLNTLFVRTAAVAWNHNLALLLALGASAMLLHSLRAARPLPWHFGGGLLLGLACGVRLSYLPLAAPFLLAPLWFHRHEPWRERAKRCLAFAAGGVIAAAPALVMLAAYPRETFFSVLVYPSRITPLHFGIAEQGAATLAQKLLYLGKEVIFAKGLLRVLGVTWHNAFLAAAVLGSGGLLLAGVRTGRAGISRTTVLLALLALFALVGALTPTPSMYQYFYQVVPFLFLLVVSSLYDWLAGQGDSPGKVLGDRLVMAACLVLVLAGGHTLVTTTWERWHPNGRWGLTKFLDTAERIMLRAPQGRILTLSPIYPLSAGLQIYPELATGPFDFRTARLLTPEERGLRPVMDAQNMTDVLAARPPAAVLVGFESPLDAPLEQWARANGYSPHRLPKEPATLWLAPAGNGPNPAGP